MIAEHTPKILDKRCAQVLTEGIICEPVGSVALVGRSEELMHVGERSEVQQVESPASASLTEEQRKELEARFELSEPSIQALAMGVAFSRQTLSKRRR